MDGSCSGSFAERCSDQAENSNTRVLDTRGLRRPRETPIFAKTPFNENDDPMLPSGFSP